MNRVAACRVWNLWPFAGGPEAMTLAQMLMLDEALAQLGGGKRSGGEGAPAAGKKPRRLKGQRKAEFFRMMMEQAHSDQ